MSAYRYADGTQLRCTRCFDPYAREDGLCDPCRQAGQSNSNALTCQHCGRDMTDVPLMDWTVDIQKNIYHARCLETVKAAKAKQRARKGKR